MDNATITLIVTQSLTFIIMLVSEILKVPPSSTASALIAAISPTPQTTPTPTTPIVVTRPVSAPPPVELSNFKRETPF